jgi:hypothetical protein
VLREILPASEQRSRMGAAARRRMETWSPREYTEGMVRAVQIARVSHRGFRS